MRPTLTLRFPADPRSCGAAGMVLMLVVLMTAAAGCHREAPAPGGDEARLPVAEVSVVVATSGVHRATEEATGSLRASARAAIEAKVSGRLASLRVAPGRRVAAGELLAEVDVGEIRARATQAAAVAQQAERELGRMRTLLAQEAVTQSEFDAAESRQRVANAAVAEAETLLGYARVTAPFAGVVTRKWVDEGNLVGPGRPILELEDPGSLRFEADVPVRHLDRVSLGDRLPVTLSTVPEALEGVVGEIDPSADPASRTFRIRLDLAPSKSLRAGLFGRVSIPVGESTVLTIPEAAVLRRGQLEMVQVVVEGRARLRMVRTGKRLSGDVEILSGLEPGEQVVTEGAAALQSGQPVKAR